MNTTGLTDDEMRVRIAEFCGWRNCFYRPSQFSTPWLSGINPKPDHIVEIIPCDGSPPRGATPEDYNQPETLPDYLNDLNAMHAAEKSLPESLHEKHIIELEDQAQQEVGRAAWAKMQPHIRLRSIAMLPVRRRALAFLAMLPEPEAAR